MELDHSGGRETKEEREGGSVGEGRRWRERKGGRKVGKKTGRGERVRGEIGEFKRNKG